MAVVKNACCCFASNALIVAWSGVRKFWGLGNFVECL
jgi:hypothetical protein